MKSLNQPYKKQFNSEGELINAPTKENPYLSRTAIPTKDGDKPGKPIIVPSRSELRMGRKYIQLTGGGRLKIRGNNRNNKLEGRTKRF